jgi:hypothetical protein
MNSPLQVTIVRAGNEVGTYELAEVLRLLGTGTLKPTDLYWHEGMVGWEPLSKLDNSEGLKLPAEPEVKRQSSNKLFGCGGCGLLIFLFFGIYSVCLYCMSLGPPNNSNNAFAEAGAYCCCPISLLGLCIFIINKKRREWLPLGEPPA